MYSNYKAASFIHVMRFPFIKGYDIVAVFLLHLEREILPSSSNVYSIHK